jgi:hypothetical protein
MSNELEYDYRFCCFIDILGFKNHINELEINDKPNMDKVESIHIALKKIKEIGENSQVGSQDCKISQFSDNIVISFSYYERGQFLSLLLSILHIQLELVQMGFLIRGGISIERLFHSNEFVFGKALVKAYELESKQAKYPRIILNDDAIEIAKEFGEHNPKQEEKYIRQLAKKDDDGQWYLDYFQSAMSEFDTYSYEYGEVIEVSYKYIENIENNFLSNFNSMDKKCGYYDKLDWLNNKLNDFKNYLSELEQKIIPQP